MKWTCSTVKSHHIFDVHLSFLQSTRDRHRSYNSRPSKPSHKGFQPPRVWPWVLSGHVLCERLGFLWNGIGSQIPEDS